MTRDCLEVDVREFLRTHVSSLGDLKVLLALVSGGARWWDAQAMGASTDLDASGAGRCLEGLAAKNVLDIRISETVRYRLRAGTRERGRGLEAFSHAYRKSPGVVISWAAADMCRDPSVERRD